MKKITKILAILSMVFVGVFSINIPAHADLTKAAASITTDAVYYSTGATSVDYNVLLSKAYNASQISYAKVSLIHKSTNTTIEVNTIVGLTGVYDFIGGMSIYPTDPRGTYYLKVIWYGGAGNALYYADSSEFYLTK